MISREGLVACYEHLDKLIVNEIEKSMHLKSFLEDSNTKIESSSGSVDIKNDIEVITREIHGMNVVRRIIEKINYSTEVDIKADALMDIQEKELYYKIVKVSLRIKRFFDKFKRKKND
jgi:hypothetical protein